MKIIKKKKLKRGSKDSANSKDLIDSDDLKESDDLRDFFSDLVLFYFVLPLKSVLFLVSAVTLNILLVKIGVHI